MNLSELVVNLIASLAAGLAVLGAALLAQNVAAKAQRKHKKRNETIDKIAVALLTEKETTALEVPLRQAPSDRVVPNSGHTSFPLPSNSHIAAHVGFGIETLSSFHEQALSQASVQFWFSIMAAVTGFVWILYSGLEVNGNLVMATKILPGAVIDAVAYLFFKQASQTRRAATALYDKLREEKLMADSAALVLSIDNPLLRSAIRAQIALHMAGLTSNSIDLNKFLEHEYTTTSSANPC
jgi:hypothetical protein